MFLNKVSVRQKEPLPLFLPTSGKGASGSPLACTHVYISKPTITSRFLSSLLIYTCSAHQSPPCDPPASFQLPCSPLTPFQVVPPTASSPTYCSYLIHLHSAPAPVHATSILSAYQPSLVCSSLCPWEVAMASYTHNDCTPEDWFKDTCPAPRVLNTSLISLFFSGGGSWTHSLFYPLDRELDEEIKIYPKAL